MASTSSTPGLSLSSQSSIYNSISSLMTAYDQPILAVQNQVTNLQNLDTIYSTLQGDLAAVASAASAMADPVAQPMAARTVSSSDASVVSATAAAGTAPGSYSISVSQLAQPDTLVSNQYTDGGTDIVHAEGAGQKSFTVTVNGQSQDVSVTLTTGETNSDVISAVAAAINTAFAGVNSANAVTANALADTSTTSKLVLASDQTGATYQMTLADDQNGGTLLATLGLGNTSVAATGTTGGYIYAPSALDAQMTVNGVAVTRDSNTASDVIPGVTLNVNGQQAAGAQPVSLVVSADSNAITTTVQNFISAYNSALSYLQSQTAVSTQTGAGNPLSGEMIYNNLVETLWATAGAAVSNTGSAQVKTLADIGITQASNGSLSLSDTQTFNQALKSNPSAVAALFTSTNGIANQLNAVLTPFSQPGGLISSEENNTNSQISTLNNTIQQMNNAAAMKELELINEYSQLQQLQSTLSSQQTFMTIILEVLGSTGSATG